MPWGAVAGAVIGAYASNNAAKKGAKATDQASQGAIDLQREMFNTTRQDQAPWMEAGRGALGQLSALNSGDYSGFNNSPDYLWAREQGLQGVDRSAAARGGMYSGGADADRMKFASGLATQNLGNYRGSLQSMAGLGQSTASGLGSMGMGMANNAGNAMMNAGQARSSAYQQSGNNIAGLAGGLGNMYTYGRQNGWNWGG